MGGLGALKMLTLIGVTERPTGQTSACAYYRTPRGWWSQGQFFWKPTRDVPEAPIVKESAVSLRMVLLENFQKPKWQEKG